MPTRDVPPAVSLLALLLLGTPDDAGPPPAPTPVDRVLPFGVPVVVVPSGVDPIHAALDAMTPEELDDWPTWTIEVDETDLDLNH